MTDNRPRILVPSMFPYNIRKRSYNHLRFRACLKMNVKTGEAIFLVKIQLRQRSIAGYVTAPRLDFNKKVPDQR